MRIQDSVVGHAVRILTKGPFFKYTEDKDPSLWQRYINFEKSGRMAYTGRIDVDSVQMRMYSLAHHRYRGYRPRHGSIVDIDFKASQECESILRVERMSM